MKTWPTSEPCKVDLLRGKETGRKAVIIANGPSVHEMEFARLTNESVVIGMNASILLSDQYLIDFDYYCFSDVRFFAVEAKRRMADRVLESNALVVVRKEVEKCVAHQFRRQVFPVLALARDGFSFDLGKGYYFGCTTTMLALQLAYHLGVSEVVIAGLDLTYSDAAKPRFYAEDSPQVVDDLRSVQIWNLANATRRLEEVGIGVSLASANSVMRPYIRYADFQKLKAV